MSFNGEIRVPSDKSISHRAVLFSALAEGTSHLTDLLPSDDVLSSLAAVEQLGAQVQRSQGANGIDAVITGFGGQPTATGSLTLDCGNSGTTTRLLTGLVCGLGVDALLVGDESLSSRPMGRVIDPLTQMGASFESNNGKLPVRIKPCGSLNPISYQSPKASAQVKSAVLLAGLQARGTTSVEEPARSRDHTELLLPAFGVPVQVEGLKVSVQGPAVLKAHDMGAPGDPSSASFIAVAAAITPGSDVLIQQVSLNPTRTGAFEVLRRMGADISYENQRTEGAEPVGDVRVRYTEGLAGTVVTPVEIPTLIDEIPVLCLAAAYAKGETVFQNAGELRVKESDRFELMVEGLTDLGIRAFGAGDDLHVLGVGGLPPVSSQPQFDTVDEEVFHDHRMAMTWHLAGRAFGINIAVDDPDCVSVSWPCFYEDVARLCGE